jgi:prevent-host-death family protein
MRSVTFTEFRAHASSILNDVENGHIVRISRHGRVVAEIVPCSDDRPASWQEPGQRLVVKGASLTRAILQERKRGR